MLYHPLVLPSTETTFLLLTCLITFDCKPGFTLKLTWFPVTIPRGNEAAKTGLNPDNIRDADNTETLKMSLPHFFICISPSACEVIPTSPPTFFKD
jgi:hypothetical protein